MCFARNRLELIQRYILAGILKLLTLQSEMQRSLLTDPEEYSSKLMIEAIFCDSSG